MRKRSGVFGDLVTLLLEWGKNLVQRGQQVPPSSLKTNPANTDFQSQSASFAMHLT